MVGTALRASTKLAKVVICFPHFVTAHCTIGSLNEYATSSNPVTIAASTLGTITIGDRYVSNESGYTVKNDKKDKKDKRARDIQLTMFRR